MLCFKFILQFPLFCMHKCVAHFCAGTCRLMSMWILEVNFEYHFIDAFYLAFVMVVSLLAWISLIELVKLASTV